MTQTQFLAWLKMQIVASGKTQADFARGLKISPQWLHQVVSGDRPPSGALLQRLGFERRVEIVPLKLSA